MANESHEKFSNVDRRKFLIQTGKAAIGTSVLPNPASAVSKDSGHSNPGPEPLTLFLSGDVMTGRGIDQVLPFSTDPRLFEPYIKDAKRYVEIARWHSGAIPDEISYKYVWGDAIEVLEKIDPDIRIINLETAVTLSSDRWKGKRIHYRMHPRNISLLSTAGIDACVLGNNHALDWGFEGLRETLETLHGEDIATAGAGTNRASAAKPAVFPGDEGRLLLFSWATPDAGAPLAWSAEENRPGLNVLPDLTQDTAEKVVRNVEKHRSEDDRVVVSLHWGGNWGYEVPTAQQEFARHLVDADAADIIHGHSSHHPKGIEMYKERPILYGCGDLINDYEGISGHEKYRSELSLMYFPRIDAGGALDRFEMIPMKMHRFRLNRPDEEETEWLTDIMNRECQKFGTGVNRKKDGRLILNHES